MESNPGSRSRKQRQNATRSQLMGREVIPSTAAIQFPLAAIHPRSCNTPARFDSKRSTDLCVRTRSDPWGRCSFPCCRNVGESFVCPSNPHGSLDRRFYTLSLRRRLPWCVHKRAKYHKLGRKALFTRVSIRETRCEVATRKKNGGRGEGEGIETVCSWTEMQAGHGTTENEASVCEALPGFA